MARDLTPYSMIRMFLHLPCRQILPSPQMEEVWYENKEMFLTVTQIKSSGGVLRASHLLKYNSDLYLNVQQTKIQAYDLKETLNNSTFVRDVAGLQTFVVFQCRLSSQFASLNPLFAFGK